MSATGDLLRITFPNRKQSATYRIDVLKAMEKSLQKSISVLYAVSWGISLLACIGKVLPFWNGGSAQVTEWWQRVWHCDAGYSGDLWFSRCLESHSQDPNTDSAWSGGDMPVYWHLFCMQPSRHYLSLPYLGNKTKSTMISYIVHIQESRHLWMQSCGYINSLLIRISASTNQVSLYPWAPSFTKENIPYFNNHIF